MVHEPRKKPLFHLSLVSRSRYFVIRTRVRLRLRLRIRLGEGTRHTAYGRIGPCIKLHVFSSNNFATSTALAKYACSHPECLMPFYLDNVVVSCFHIVQEDRRKYRSCSRAGDCDTQNSCTDAVGIRFGVMVTFIYRQDCREATNCRY